jgi:chemotaxis protein methyltransferase CheR
MQKISANEIQVLAGYIRDLSGIALNQSKAYLFETRLGPLLAEEGLLSYTELYRKARGGPGRDLENRIINAISTNETLFFRDKGPFELLRHKLLPDLVARRRAKKSRLLPIPLRIWSAACSTGQELYSIAIVVKELLGDNLSGFRLKLLGTDISDAAIAQACRGRYSKFEIERGLPGDKLVRYFTPISDGWQVKDELRTMAAFRRLNLMLPFGALGKFDIIFCRNVAIYFDTPDRRKLFARIADMLAPDGYLIIGSTESLTGVCDRFAPQRHLGSVYYQLKNAAASRKQFSAGGMKKSPRNT